MAFVVLNHVTRHCNRLDFFPIISCHSENISTAPFLLSSQSLQFRDRTERRNVHICLDESICFENEAKCKKKSNHHVVVVLSRAPVAEISV